MNFEYFQIQKMNIAILELDRKKKMKKMVSFVQHPCSFHELWSLNYLRKCIFCNFVLTSARNLGLLKQLHICIWKVSLRNLRKWYCLLCYDLLFQSYQYLKLKNFVKFLQSQHLFSYFNCLYLMNGGLDSYKSYHFLKECNENFRMHICKLL